MCHVLDPLREPRNWINGRNANSVKARASSKTLTDASLRSFLQVRSCIDVLFSVYPMVLAGAVVRFAQPHFLRSYLLSVCVPRRWHFAAMPLCLGFDYWDGVCRSRSHDYVKRCGYWGAESVNGGVSLSGRVLPEADTFAKLRLLNLNTCRCLMVNLPITLRIQLSVNFASVFDSFTLKWLWCLFSCLWMW